MSAETRSNQQHALAIDRSMASTSMREALLTWSGYVKFRAAEMPQGASPAIFVNGIEHHAHLQQVHTAVEPVRDLGLYFLPQATVSGHCYVFAGDDFIVDGSSPNRIALQWAASEGYLGAANRRQEHLIDLAQPALVVAGPGHNVWGHWLLDFLPRLAIAKQLLGSELTRFRIPVPTDTPDWVFKLASFFCGIDRESFIAYVRGAEAVSCQNGAVTPTYAHSNYFLHSYLKSLYFPVHSQPQPRRA